MRIIGGKWKGSILWHVKDGPIRFNELARLMPGASRKMIAQRLSEMEEQKLIKREVLTTRPIAVQYMITPFGETSIEILKNLKDWTEEQGL